MLSADVEQIRRKLSRGVGELQTNADRLQAVLSSMREGILAVGADKTILLANDAGAGTAGIFRRRAAGPAAFGSHSRPPRLRCRAGCLCTSPSRSQREFDVVGSQRRRLALRANRLARQSLPGRDGRAPRRERNPPAGKPSPRAGRQRLARTQDAAGRHQGATRKRSASARSTTPSTIWPSSPASRSRPSGCIN